MGWSVDGEEVGASPGKEGSIWHATSVAKWSSAALKQTPVPFHVWTQFGLGLLWPLPLPLCYEPLCYAPSLTVSPPGRGVANESVAQSRWQMFLWK